MKLLFNINAIIYESLPPRRLGARPRKALSLSHVINTCLPRDLASAAKYSKSRKLTVCKAHSFHALSTSRCQNRETSIRVTRQWKVSATPGDATASEFTKQPNVGNPQLHILTTESTFLSAHFVCASKSTRSFPVRFVNPSSLSSANISSA